MSGTMKNEDGVPFGSALQVTYSIDNIQIPHTIDKGYSVANKRPIYFNYRVAEDFPAPPFKAVIKNSSFYTFNIRKVPP